MASNSSENDVLMSSGEESDIDDRLFEGEKEDFESLSSILGDFKSSDDDASLNSSSHSSACSDIDQPTTSKRPRIT